MTDGDLQHLIRLWRRKLESVRPVQPRTELRDQFLRAMLSSGDLQGDMPFAFRETRFVVKVRDSRLHARTALDCLALPLFLGERVWVSTSCLASGRPIAMQLVPQGVVSCDPETCMMTVLSPGPDEGLETASVNQLMGFFASPQEVSLWVMPYPEITVLPIAEAWQLAQGIYGNTQQEGLYGN